MCPYPVRDDCIWFTKCVQFTFCVFIDSEIGLVFVQKVHPPSAGQQEATLACERVNAHTGSTEQTSRLSSSLPPESLTIRTFDVSTDNRFLAAASGDHRHVTLWDLKLESTVAKYTIAKKWASHEVVRVIMSSRTNRVVVILRAVDDTGNDVSNTSLSQVVPSSCVRSMAISVVAFISFAPCLTSGLVMSI